MRFAHGMARADYDRMVAQYEADAARGDQAAKAFVALHAKRRLFKQEVYDKLYPTTAPKTKQKNKKAQLKPEDATTGKVA